MKSTDRNFAQSTGGTIADRLPAGGTPAVAGMAGRPRLNLLAIEETLVSVQREFPRINAALTSRRDPLTDEVVANMLAGYRWVDHALAEGIDLFKMGKSDHLLELNRIVLCGAVGGGVKCCPKQRKITEEHFYANDGGVGLLMEWLELHRHATAWRRAAGVFVRVLSQPQLYLEGNHRTGALLVSYLLAREGLPPFVLTVRNARHFFEPATLIKKSRKRGMDNLLKLPKMTKRLAKLFENDADDGYLLKM